MSAPSTAGNSGSGATVETLYTGTTRLIEDELNGAANILSFESATDTFGVIEITANFQNGTDPSLAGVEVQNRLKRVEARLPAEVRLQGILVAIRAWHAGKSNPLGSVQLAMREREIDHDLIGGDGDD